MAIAFSFLGCFIVSDCQVKSAENEAKLPHELKLQVRDLMTLLAHFDFLLIQIKANYIWKRGLYIF